MATPSRPTGLRAWRGQTGEPTLDPACASEQRGEAATAAGGREGLKSFMAGATAASYFPPVRVN